MVVATFHIAKWSTRIEDEGGYDASKIRAKPIASELTEKAEADGMEDVGHETKKELLLVWGLYYC